MCDITDIKTNRRVGYKVLAYKNGKFYSTFTGQQIKPGKVPLPPTRVKRLSNHWNSVIDDNTLRSCRFYKKSFVGKTSAFIKKSDALFLYRDINCEAIFSDNTIVELVKITFTNNVFIGSYGGDNIIASDTIKSIKIIKTK